MSGSRSQQAVEPRAAKSRASHRLEKLAGVAASAALATGFLGGTPALAYTPPPAAVRVATPPLPDDGGETILLDYGKVMGASTKKQLTGELRDLEESTGWKLRLLTSYGAVSAPPVRAAQQYWRADPKTIVVTVDETMGNVVEFYYDLGQSLKTTVPKNVFQELRGRYGNVYYMRESGAESAVVEVLGVLRGCLAQGGCKFVPGLSEQQRQFSLISITSGAFLSGAVLRNGLSRWTYIFLFIWVPWIGLFGFYPLYVRQPDDLTPLFQNAGIFATIFSLTWLSPLLGEVTLPFAAAKGDGDAPPPPPAIKPSQPAARDHDGVEDVDGEQRRS